jgi:Fe2+ transport system protein B
VALLASFIAKENAIAALGILYGAGMPGDGLAATLAASIPTASALSFIAATLLFIPCVATCAVMRKELGDWRWIVVCGDAALGHRRSDRGFDLSRRQPVDHLIMTGETYCSIK